MHLLYRYDHNLILQMQGRRLACTASPDIFVEGAFLSALDFAGVKIALAVEPDPMRPALEFPRYIARTAAPAPRREQSTRC